MAATSAAERPRLDAQVRELMMRAQIASDPMDIDLARAIERARDLPDIRLPLLNVAVVRAITLKRGVTATIDRLEAEAIEHHMSAMRALAILHRTEALSELGLGSTSFAELIEAQVLLEDETQPARSRCSGFIRVGSVYGRLRLYELEDDALGEALRLLGSSDEAAEGRSVVRANRAGGQLWHAFDALEVGLADIAEHALDAHDATVEMIEWDLLPTSWRREDTFRRKIARAVSEGRFVEGPAPSSDELEPRIFDEVCVLHQLVTPPSTWSAEPDLTAVDPVRSSVAHFLHARALRIETPPTRASAASDAYARTLAQGSRSVRLSSGSAISAGIQARRLQDEHASLRLESLTDALTGIANRRRFDAVIDAHRGADAALLSIDLDRFKRVNDTFGHQVGDDVLCRVASTVATAVGVELVESGELSTGLVEAPLVTRLGGDEFAVLLLGPHRVNANEIARHVERALAAVDWSDLIGDWTQIASIGVAEGPCGEELVGSADRALYDRKPRMSRR